MLSALSGSSVEDYSGNGDAIVLADNGRAIDAALAAYNQERNWPPVTQFSASPQRTDCSYQAGRGRFTALALLAMSGLVRRWRRRRPADATGPDAPS